MANSITHAGLPYPIRKARFSVEVAFRAAAGTPTDPSTPDTEYSINGGASFTDTAEEITTGGSNGMGYLTLTGAEMDNPSVVLAAKSANCVTTPLVLRPRSLAIVGSGTLSAGSAGGGTLGTLLAYDVTGCFIRTTGGTGGGGTGGANNQARKIITYDTSTGAFTVSPNWETTPSTDTTYDVLLPEGVTLGMLRALNPTTAGRTLAVESDGMAHADLKEYKGTVPANLADTDKLPASVQHAANNVITAASIASDAVTPAKIKDGAFTAAKFASGAFDAVWSVTTRTLSAAGVQAIWDAATSALTTVGSIGKLLVDRIDAAISSRSTYDGSDTAGTTTLLSRLTSSRAGYLDNLNVGGAVASQADINAINQSASRRILLTTVGQYERPESGSTTYTIEARTFDGDGAATNADSNPTLTGTGQTSGSLAGNIGTITNPATGVYRWPYTVSSSATIEPVRFDVSATIGGNAFTLSVYTQVVDLVGTTFTTADRTKIEAVYDKLPSADYLTGTANSNGSGYSTLDAAGVRTAVGLAAANLDAQLGTLATASALSTLATTVGAAGAGLTEAGGTGDHLTALATQASVDDLPTNSELATALTTGLTTALTEGYRGTGATGSVRDLLYEIVAHMGESSISGTTKTLKKIDGSTTAKVYSLDSATTPTSITETM